GVTAGFASLTATASIARVIDDEGCRAELLPPVRQRSRPVTQVAAFTVQVKNGVAAAGRRSRTPPGVQPSAVGANEPHVFDGQTGGSRIDPILGRPDRVIDQIVFE